MSKKLSSKSTQIHERALSRGRLYLKCEADLIESIQEVDGHKVYLDYNCRSLHVYVSELMGLGDAIANNFIAVARKAKEVPALQAVIASGKLQVQKARKITPVLNQENQEFWLKLAIEKPQRVIEKEVARERPELVRPERVSYLTDTRLNMSVNISSDVHDLLCRVRDLESQRLKKAATLEESLAAALKVYLEKKDPVEKAKRAKTKREKRALSAGVAGQGKQSDTQSTKSPAAQSTMSSAAQNMKPPAAQSTMSLAEQSMSAVQNTGEAGVTDSHVARHTKRPSRPASLEHQRNIRDQGQCTHVDETGKRCGERRWLQGHHIVPVSEGGVDLLDNLTTLCFGHHRLVHHKGHMSNRV